VSILTYDCPRGVEILAVVAIQGGEESWARLSVTFEMEPRK